MRNMMKLLLIEDDALICSLFQERFETWGYHVSAFADAETALETYQREFYPLIVLDLGLPGMD